MHRVQPGLKAHMVPKRGVLLLGLGEAEVELHSLARCLLLPPLPSTRSAPPVSTHTATHTGSAPKVPGIEPCGFKCMCNVLETVLLAVQALEYCQAFSQ